MTSTMLRRCVTAAVALAALTAAGAAPEASPFAGTYAWGSWPAPITISDGGQITSSFGGSSSYKGSISGRVKADGSCSFTLSESYLEHGPRDHGRHKSSVEYAGTMALDAEGNIAATQVIGGSFVWVRQ